MTREVNNNGETNRITITMQADIAGVSDQEFLRKLVMGQNRKNNIRNNMLDTVESVNYTNNIVQLMSSQDSDDSAGTLNQAIPFIRTFTQSSNLRSQMNRQRNNQSPYGRSDSPVDQGAISLYMSSFEDIRNRSRRRIRPKIFNRSAVSSQDEIHEKDQPQIKQRTQNIIKSNKRQPLFT